MIQREGYERVIVSPEALRDRFIDAFVYAKSLIAQGKRVHVTVREALEPIRTKQRIFLKDIVFGQIAEQVMLPPDNARYTKEAWAELYRKEMLGYRHEMQRLPGAKKSTPVRIRNSTEELGVKLYAEYTDRVIAHAASEHGVKFHFTREDRE